MRRSLTSFVVLVALIPAFASAQSPSPTPVSLETLVAPVALYPDPLLANVLAASTYPVQIIEASRAIAGGAKPTAAEMSQWDTSVQALTAYPSVLNMMSNQLSWTTELGQAVSQSQKNVMAAVQQVRVEAQKAGNLQSNDKQTVSTTETNTIVIEPANPEVIYVPQYNPVAIVAPAPAYAMYPAGYGLMTFSAGFAAGALTAYACDWGHGGSITVNNNYNYNNVNNYNRNTNINSANYSSWKAPTNVGRVDSPGSTNVGSGTSGARYGSGQRQGDSYGQARGGDQYGGRGNSELGGSDRSFGGGGDRWGSQGGMFGGANGGGWDSRAASDRGGSSFGGGGFGGFGARGGGFGGFSRGGGGRRF